VVVDLQLHVQSVPITTKVVSLNSVHGEVHSIQHYVIKFVSDLRQVGGFLRVLRFPPPIELAAITEILLKVVLNTINLKQTRRNNMVLHEYGLLLFFISLSQLSKIYV